MPARSYAVTLNVFVPGDEVSSCDPLGRSPLQLFIPDPLPSSQENDAHTCCPTRYVAPSAGAENVIRGGVVSTIVYWIVSCETFSCWSTAATVNENVPSRLVSSGNPTGMFEAQARIPRPPGSSAQP